MSRNIGLVYISLIIGLMLLAPEILYIMGGELYMDAIVAMPPVILAMICQYYYAFYFNVEYFYGETYIISIGTSVSAMVNLGLNYYFVPRYGYVAAAYTTFVGYAVMLLYHYSIVKFKLKKAFVYDNRAIFLLIVFSIIVQYGISFAYSDNFIRYIIVLGYIFVMGMVVYKYRQSVSSYINKII